MIYNIKSSKKQAKVIYKGIPVRLSGYFSEETLKAKRDCHNIFKLIKKKKTYNQEYSTQQYYHTDLEGRLRILHSSWKLKRSKKLKEFDTMKPALH